MASPDLTSHLDIIHASPVLSAWITDQVTQHTGLRIGSDTRTWVDFAATWDFAAEWVLVDALLQDHVPLALKVRALRRLGCEVAVLGPGTDTPLARRAVHEGARLWLDSTGPTPVGAIAPLLGALASSHPVPTARGADAPFGPRLTDREIQVLALYASPAAPSVRHLARALTVHPETVRTHLRSGRARFREDGHDVSTRVLLARALEASGYLIPMDVLLERGWV